MNPLGQYLNDFAMRKSDIRTAQIVARNDDGTYMAKYVTTKALVRASKLNQAEEYKVGSWVTLGAPSAGRAVIGANHLILSRATAEQRGASTTAPDVSHEAIPSAAVLSVTPDPLVLVAGGLAHVQTIRGHGFRTGAVYDEHITNDVDPVVTDTEVTMTIKADAGAAAGLRSGVIDNQPLKDVVKVVRSLHGLWIVGHQDVPATKSVVLLLDAATLEQLASFELFGAFNTHNFGLTDTLVYLKGGAYYYTFDRATNEQIAGFSADPIACSNSIGPFASGGGKFFYARAENISGSPATLEAFDTASDTEGGWAIPGITTSSDIGTWLDPAGLYLWIVYSAKVIKWDIGGAAIVLTHTFNPSFPGYAYGDQSVRAFAPYDGAVFICTDTNNDDTSRIIRKYDSATFAVLATSIDFAVSHPVREMPPWGRAMQVVAGRLYATMLGSAPGVGAALVEFDIDTLAIIATVALPVDPRGFLYRDGVFYIFGVDSSITRVSSMIVRDHTVLAIPQIDALMYA